MEKETYKALLGDPTLSPSDMETQPPGVNKIVVNTIQYGYQAMIMEKDIPVKMSDGITLYVNVFRPDKLGTFPVIMSADSYGKNQPCFLEKVRPFWPGIGAFPISNFCNVESPDPGFWIPNDYVVIKLAVRGSSNSEGGLHPWTHSEARDYYEAVEWASAQEWSNGNVGTCGVSYLAVTQWMMAALNPPHLKAIIPWEGLNDVYREAAFHGGIPETGFFKHWVGNNFKRWAGREVDDLCAAQKEHPLLDEFWEERRAFLGNIKVPILACASWSTIGLHNRGGFEGFKQAASTDKWLYVHGRKEWEIFYDRESLELQKSFFDYYLKGIQNDWKQTPNVRLEVRDKFFKGEIRYENEWPIARTKYTLLFLNNENRSLERVPPVKETVLSYNVDRTRTESDELRYKIVFDEETEITGHMKLRLWVAAEGSDDMDIFVGIKKFDKRNEEVCFPDFNHIDCGHVANGWLRVSHRELDEKNPCRGSPGSSIRIFSSCQMAKSCPWTLKSGPLALCSIQVSPWWWSSKEAIL